MTSPLYLYPACSRPRVSGRLWVNKVPNQQQGQTATRMNPITKWKIPKHKAYRPPLRHK